MAKKEVYNQLRTYCQERDILFSKALMTARERWIQKHTPDVYKKLKKALGRWCSVKFRQIEVETAWFTWIREAKTGLKRDEMQQQAVIEFLHEEKNSIIEQLIKDFAEVHNRSISDVVLQAIDEYYSKPGRERPKYLTPETRKKALSEFLDTQKAMVLKLYQCRSN